MIGDFVLVLLVVGGGLALLFVRSTRKDHQDRAIQAEHARREWAAAAEEARKYQAGARLVCLSCDTHFTGPLTDTGCPMCHLASLVVTEP